MKCNFKQSNTVRGTLWLVAALPFVLGPTVFGGSNAAIGVGIVFLLLGVTTFRKS